MVGRVAVGLEEVGAGEKVGDKWDHPFFGYCLVVSSPWVSKSLWLF